MNRNFACFATLTIGFLLLSPLAIAQEDERYDFDGVADIDPQPADPTDWMTSENWSDAGGDPIPPFGPPIPDFGTRVEIVTSTVGVNAPVIGPGDVAEAFGVRIGRSDGEGLLTMTGGTLELVDSCLASPFTCNRRLRVGNDDGTNFNSGTFNLSGGIVTADNLWIGSGSQGTMNMSAGVVNTRSHFFFDWTFATGGALNMTGGTINVGTTFASPFLMHRSSSLNLDGGEILVNGAARLGSELDNPGPSAGGQQIPGVTVSITDGLLESSDFLQIGGSITIDGGILRADSFNEAVSAGTVEINATGILQFNNANENVSAVEALISSGFFITSEASPLTVEIVDVGGTDFTQVSSTAAGLLGDFDGDGDADGFDFLKWQRGESPSPLSASDLTDWEGNFGAVSVVAAVAVVPESSSVVLALLVAVGMTLGGRNFWQPFMA